MSLFGHLIADVQRGKRRAVRMVSLRSVRERRQIKSIADALGIVPTGSTR